MHVLSATRVLAKRRRLLALCVGSVFASAISIPTFAFVPPATWTVNTCKDDNSGDVSRRIGSLRFAVANAGAGSTIDLSRLPTTYNCSVITLGTGSIKSGLEVDQDNLTLQGPAGASVTISGKHPDSDDASNVPARIIDHRGNGTLSVNNLTLVTGRAFDARTERGACILSNGSVSVSHSAVCGATILSSAVPDERAAKAAGGRADLYIATPEAPYRSPLVDND